ncbi:MAG: hypothetical protein ACD_28C00011G0014 [uncultured bacterium]|nr:MAG: hypothetical protein ACD_28C00011G0014 [uncultured bacterium]KKT74256.1 MAG: hypothetical protein UW70_C0061G0011 [Candidatus Peregrinibacteria bacterium GW2011_GWA2_44_7]
MQVMKNFASTLIQNSKNNLIYKNQEQSHSSQDIQKNIDAKNNERVYEVSRLGAMQKKLTEVTQQLDGVARELAITLKEKAVARSELKAMEVQRDVDPAEQQRLQSVVANYTSREATFRELLRSKTELPGEIQGQAATVSRLDNQIRQAKMDLAAQLAQERQAAAEIKGQKSREAAQARLNRYQEALRKEEAERLAAQKRHQGDVQKANANKERLRQEKQSVVLKETKDLLFQDSLADYEAFDAAMNTYEEKLAQRTANLEADTATALVEGKEGKPTTEKGKTLVGLKERSGPRASGEAKTVIPPQQEVKLVTPFIQKSNGDVWAQVADKDGKPKGTYVAVRYKGNRYISFNA